MSEVAGRVAVVTGAARGIGRAIAEDLIAGGARVALIDIDGEGVARAADALGPESLAVPTDIADLAAVERAVAAIETRWGGADILINNAAVADLTGFDALTLEHWRRIFSINLDGALHLSMALVPAMRARGGGAIVHIASIMGMLGSPGGLAYSAAKGALINLTRAMACDLAPGIRVNAVAPGFIDTPMARLADGSHEHDAPVFREFYLGQGRIPLRRAGLPADIAGPVRFLASDCARYITGHVLVVDGGVTATF